MEIPRWVREPYMFLRFLVPGFFILAMGMAFFPQHVSGVMVNNWLAQRHEGVAVMMLLFFSLMIGVMMQVAFRVLRETLVRPPSKAQEALRAALLRAGVPADRLSRGELRAVFEAAAGRAPGGSGVEGERLAIELGYLACMAVATVGAVLAAGLGEGPLVSVPWHEAQGAAFVGSAVFLGFTLRLREQALGVRELAAFPVEDPETIAAAVRACHRLWGAQPA